MLLGWMATIELGEKTFVCESMSVRKPSEKSIQFTK